MAGLNYLCSSSDSDISNKLPKLLRVRYARIQNNIYIKLRWLYIQYIYLSYAKILGPNRKWKARKLLTKRSLAHSRKYKRYENWQKFAKNICMAAINLSFQIHSGIYEYWGKIWYIQKYQREIECKKLKIEFKYSVFNWTSNKWQKLKNWKKIYNQTLARFLTNTETPNSWWRKATKNAFVRN